MARVTHSSSKTYSVCYVPKRFQRVGRRFGTLATSSSCRASCERRNFTGQSLCNSINLCLTIGTEHVASEWKVSVRRVNCIPVLFVAKVLLRALCPWKKIFGGVSKCPRTYVHDHAVRSMVTKQPCSVMSTAYIRIHIIRYL